MVVEAATSSNSNNSSTSQAQLLLRRAEKAVRGLSLKVEAFTSLTLLWIRWRRLTWQLPIPLLEHLSGIRASFRSRPRRYPSLNLNPITKTQLRNYPLSALKLPSQPWSTLKAKERFPNSTLLRSQSSLPRLVTVTQTTNEWKELVFLHNNEVWLCYLPFCFLIFSLIWHVSYLTLPFHKYFLCF